MFDDILRQRTSNQPTQPAVSEEASVEPEVPATPHMSLPSDLSKSVNRWLQETAALAESYHAQPIIRAVKDLQQLWQIPGFRLAFVGEFNRGKSTLVNRLLGRTIVPVGPIPTTASLISIVAGEEEHLTIRFNDGQQIVRPVAPASWRDLIADGDLEQDQRVDSTVRITLDNAWLREIGVEIVDTPGAGDLNTQRTARLFEILSECDATIVLVSASIPLSLTERAFIEQEVLGRHIPHVIVVVSMLDTLPIEQRTMVLDSIRQRLSYLSPSLPVLPSHVVLAEQEKQEEPEGALTAIRQRIAQIATQSDRQLWRSRQIAERLVDYLAQLSRIGQEAQAAQAQDHSERVKARKKAQAALQGDALRWETIKLEFYRKRQAVDLDLYQKLTIASEELTGLLSRDLDEALDARGWWEQVFPLRLRRELLTLANEASSFVMDALTRDVAALYTEINRAFDTQLSYALRSLPTVTHAPAQISELSLTNVEQQYTLSVLGTTAAAIVSYLFVGPVGSAVSLALGWAGQSFLDGAREEQRKVVKSEVARSVNRTIEEYTRIFSQHLQNLYEEVTNTIERERQTWLKAREGVLLLVESSPAENIPWEALSARAGELREDILRALAQ